MCCLLTPSIDRTKEQLSFQDGYFPKVRLRLTSLADALLVLLVGEERLRDEPKEHLRERLHFDRRGCSFQHTSNANMKTFRGAYLTIPRKRRD